MRSGTELSDFLRIFLTTLVRKLELCNVYIFHLGYLPVSSDLYAAHFGVARLILTRLAGRNRVTGIVPDCPCSGRSRVMTKMKDSHMKTSHSYHRFLTSTPTAMANPRKEQ